MQVSKKSLNPELNAKLHQSLTQLIIDTHTPQEAALLVETLLSETERIAVTKRIGIAIMLEQHKSYEDIKTNLNVSSATIATVQSLMSQPGMHYILESIKVDLLASQWSDKFKNLFSVFKKTSSSK